MGSNYLSIPKLQQCNRWRLGMDKLFHRTLYWACDYLSMLGLKLNHVSKIGIRNLKRCQDTFLSAMKKFVDLHNDVVTWKRFPHYWSLMSRIHRWPVDSLTKGWLSGALTLIFGVSLNKLIDNQSSCQRFETPWRWCDITAPQPW